MTRRTVVFLIACGPVAAIAAPAPPDDDRAKVGKVYGTWTDPDRDCTFKLDGEELRVSIPARDHWVSKFRAGAAAAPRALREVDGDFTAVVRVSFPVPDRNRVPVAHWPCVVGGLMASVDDRQYILIRRCGGEVNRSREAIWIEHSKPDSVWTTAVGCGEPAGSAYVRLKRDGNKVTPGWSRDGKAWKDFKPETVAWGGKVQVGIVAENSLGTPVEVTFDQYRLTQPKK